MSEVRRGVNEVRICGAVKGESLGGDTKYGNKWTRAFVKVGGGQMAVCAFDDEDAGKTPATELARFRPGQSVVVEGELKHSVWNDKKTGETRYGWSVIAARAYAPKDAKRVRAADKAQEVIYADFTGVA